MPHRYTPPNNSIAIIAMKELTISTTVLAVADDFGFSTAELEEANRAIICGHTQNTMYTWDGTDPTATLGSRLGNGNQHQINGNVNLNNLKFIRQGGSDGDVTIVLEKT